MVFTSLTARRRYRTVFFALFSGLLSSCGGSGGSGGSASDSVESENDDVQTSVRDSCVVRLRLGDVTPGMRLMNFGSACDYYLDSSVIFTGDVIVEAGTTIVSGAGHFAAFEDGQLTAVGTADSPIVFQGDESSPGYWFGVRLSALSSAVLTHVTVRDGGAEAGVTSLVDTAALRVYSSTRTGTTVVDPVVSLTDVNVTGSAADGLEIGGDMRILAFNRNRFSGNAGAGVSIYPAALSSLDVASDYLGASSANGDPVVEVKRLSVSDGSTFNIPNLAVPIRFGSEDLGSISVGLNSTLTISAGAELSMPPDTGIRVDTQSQLLARGTPEQPIVFSSLPGTVWNGIRLVSTEPVVIEHAVIGNVEKPDDTLFPGAIAVNAFPDVSLSNITITTSTDWGVYCTRPYPTLTVSDISVFNARMGAVHPDCGAQ